MSNRLILAVAAAFALSFMTVGTSSATAVCDPHCSPKSLKGLTQAKDAAGDHGAQGRANAAAKQGVVLEVVDNGGTSGGTDTSGSTGGTDTSGDTPTPCTGC